jgi:transposase
VIQAGHWAEAQHGWDDLIRKTYACGLLRRLRLDEALVRELVASRPDITLDELHDELGQRGIYVGRSSIGRFLLACGLTLKKSRFTPPNSNGRMLRPRGRFGAPPRRA